MRGSRLRKLAMFLGGWLAIIAFLGTANARYYLECFSTEPNPRAAGSVRLKPRGELQGPPSNYELWLRTNEEGVCRIVFREMWCGWGGEKPQLGDELRSGCWNPAPNNSQTGKIAYGFVDADDSFLLDPRPVQRGRFGYFSVATACFAEQGESICYLYFDAGLGATERKYSITLHLAPPEPATEPSGRR